MIKLKRRPKNKYSASLQLQKIDWAKVEKIFASDRELFLKQIKKGQVLDPRTKELLILLAGGVFFGLSVFFPTLPMALAPFLVERKRFDSGHFSQRIKRLKKQKLVEVVEENGQTLVRITEAGRVRALRYKLEEIEIKKPKVWDKKWRIVIFDIPEKYKRMREIFRDHLKTMGFYMLQKSVWVHPYPCFDEVEFLRQVYHVGVNVSYIVADSIEGATDLKIHFHID